MIKIIDFKKQTKLISKLLEDENIQKLPKKNFLKGFFSKKEFAPFYFHSLQLDKKSIEKIKNAKKIFVNSIYSKEKIIKILDISNEKIEVIYPSIDIEYEKPKIVKKRVCQKFGIDNDKKIIFFTAKNLKNFGAKEFISIIKGLNHKNFVSFIAGNKKQITNLKLSLYKFDLEDKILFIEDYENIDELFLASDIFILPTHTKTFALNILKAMFCKCVVFTTASNMAKELIDTFSIMQDSYDRSIGFKVDALLQNDEDLKLIKKQNRKIAKNHTLEKNLKKIKDIFEF